MFNEGLDRDSLVTKAVGILCALSALGGVGVVLVGAGFAMFIVALACAAITVVCFMEFEKEREIFACALGAVMVAEILGYLFSETHTSSSLINVIVSLIGHAALLLYFLGNRLERNKAIIAGLLIIGDNLWRIITLCTLLSVVNSTILGGAVSEGAIRAAALGSAVCIVPALAVTILLFTGAVNYGD